MGYVQLCIEESNDNKNQSNLVFFTLKHMKHTHLRKKNTQFSPHIRTQQSTHSIATNPNNQLEHNFFLATNTIERKRESKKRNGFAERFSEINITINTVDNIE